MIQSIGFGLVAVCLLATAIMVIRSNNLIRATLWLGAMLLVTAGLYAIIGASFLAGVQILLYVGGVMTLMIFGVMITRRHDGLDVPAESANGVRAAIASVLLFVVLAAAIDKTDGLDEKRVTAATTTAELGRALLVEHVFAFEVLSILLLGTIIGAIVLARKRDLGAAVRALNAPRPFAETPAKPPSVPGDDDASSKVAA